MDRNNPNIRRRNPSGMIPALHIHHPYTPSSHGISANILREAELQAEVDKLRMTAAATILCKGALTVNMLNGISPQTAQAMQAIINAYARKTVNEIQRTKEE